MCLRVSSPGGIGFYLLAFALLYLVAENDSGAIEATAWCELEGICPTCAVVAGFGRDLKAEEIK